MLDEGALPRNRNGIRSLSKWATRKNPFKFTLDGHQTRGGVRARRIQFQSLRRQFELARGRSGSRSNALIIRAPDPDVPVLRGTTFLVECPTGSGRKMTLFERPAKEISTRLPEPRSAGDETGKATGLRRRGEVPVGPALAGLPALLRILFHGDNGAGIGRQAHQTGWTGIGGAPDPASSA